MDLEFLDSVAPGRFPQDDLNLLWGVVGIGRDVLGCVGKERMSSEKEGVALEK